MNLKLISGLALLLVAGSSCTGPGPSERKRLPGYGSGLTPEIGRKKMPNYLGDNAANGCFNEASAPFESSVRSNGFNYTNSEELVNGTIYSCICFHLPDAGNDEKLLSLISDYKSLALPMLSQWSKQQRNGVVIDLRKEESEQYSVEAYELTGPDFTFPVIIKWDRHSGLRYASLVNLSKELTGISIQSSGSEYFN